jgi:hypothetical protein
MRILTGEEKQALSLALLSAFPSLTALEEVVYFQFGEYLHQISGGGSLRAVVYDLIDWAEMTGRTDELLHAVRRANPGNPELRAFEKHYEESRPATAKTGSRRTSGAQLSPQLKYTLVQALRHLPGIDDINFRSRLLSGMRWTESLSRSNQIAIDLHQIVDELDSLGQLESGNWPLLILLDNAQAYAQGTALSRKLKNIHKQLLNFYAATES